METRHSKIHGRSSDSIDRDPGEKSRGKGRRGCASFGQGCILAELEATEAARAALLLAVVLYYINTTAYQISAA